MSRFREWLNINHPEILEEGFLKNISKYLLMMAQTLFGGDISQAAKYLGVQVPQNVQSTTDIGQEGEGTEIEAAKERKRKEARARYKMKKK